MKLISYVKSHFQENVTYIEDRPFNDQRYYIENQKLKNLGWKITKTLGIFLEGEYTKFWDSEIYQNSVGLNIRL